jgi:two-component system sensor histidine kinase and response regulator WspE
MSDDLGNLSLMELFRLEAETQTAVLTSGVLALETSASSPEMIEALMRAAHSLKGAARIVGVEAAIRVAHALEDSFVAAQKGIFALGPAHGDVLLRAVDLLTQVAQVPDDQIAPWQAQRESTIAAMVDELSALLSSAPPPRPAEAAPAQVAASEPVPADEPVAPPPPEAPTAPSAVASPPETSERVVRVAAGSLSLLLGLAGESLVQSRQLRPVVEALRDLRGRQSRLVSALNALEERASSEPVDTAALWQEQLAQVRAQAVACSQALLEESEEIEDFARRGEDLSSRMHHAVLKSRMRPLADVLRGFPRMVRDVARQLGKRVEFRVIGETTGVDRDILDQLESPINHLIRNALDHAIEPPDERTTLGKRPVGAIRLEARHRAGMLHITLDDDGRGIDLVALRAKVVARGLVTPAIADQLSESELLEFLFLPGFSTRDAVTEMSGRGVGLDVVQTMVRGLGGVVRIATQTGRGTRFVLQLPITRSVIRALLVEIAGEPYALPLTRIDRIARLAEDEVQVLEGRRHFVMDGQPVGLVEAAQVLDLPAVPRVPGDLPVVVVSDRSHRFGVIVDTFLGERDLEVRPLDARLGKVPDISSASVLESGVPVLIIDVEDLVRSIDNLLGGRRLGTIRAPSGAAAEAPQGPKRVLIVDDSITVRELERQLLEARGYAVDVAVDGVDGWNAVRSGRYQLVISDVDMPRMDGIALVRSIKEDPRLQTTPVIIVSYKERPDDRIRGLDAGADAYLSKGSFHDQTLLDMVSDLIGDAEE